ncbi:alpha/beta hydrolase [Cochleicola gelatinilyticus]|uniref:Esterase n=1 Tax=Cochleicola gelatinilyticus TaxID=1763537 RepID=A0A167KG87_9FLAO|nr:alpha/beta hydrolase [Cochleicola gelatinilyticus]OAB81861.1 esterase [Cochleicola gelatinilyticus]
MKSFFFPVYAGLLFVLLNGCAVKKTSNIDYQNERGINSETLNVFSPKATQDDNLPVLIFVHGGYWNSGNKDTYGFFGRNFAKKGVVTVIPDYTLSPKANYDEMATQIAEVVRWTEANISHYKGDPKQIYVSGHSAGGHLVALVATHPKYLKTNNTIAGVILNDAAGLDMYGYLQKNPPTTEHNYISTWTKDPAVWKEASPIYFLSEATPPFKIYVGSKSYTSIIESNARFLKTIENFQPNISFTTLTKKHVPMMTQFIFPWNKRYKEIINFMEAQ